VSEQWELLQAVSSVDLGPAGLKRVKDLLGNLALVGVWLASTCALTIRREFIIS
jgi:hypothetical protein